ncbi:hypothetical protein ETB97_001397 [Aspergillus alliaceus]|uniref:DCG1-like protein n=1 Tax=Petromyces alliaceus TaxID=209559 RepID=A0A5N7CAY1_PETAA|nr:hypothetical protein BDV23DRAFT_153890 [Aspergillus alliaceus]KAF5860554.1 hypothetical protein ETB97_001397 [Aspergillus burnettii]
MAHQTRKKLKILIINPNTSTTMTDALRPIVEELAYIEVQFDYFTAPSDKSVTLEDGRTINGVKSINSGEDSVTSALYCRPFLEPHLPNYDAFLVACYSAHPLVGMLKESIAKLEEADMVANLHKSVPLPKRRYVTGIFEASVLMSLSLVGSFHLTDLGKTQSKEMFGIISTGSIWRAELGQAVEDFLLNSHGNSDSIHRFAGVGTTGLTAVQLHTTPADEVSNRIREATQALLKSAPHPVTSICLGCAGMAGMQKAVKQGCIDVYGRVQGDRVRIVDGVVAGAGMLVAACKGGF